jgi:hypothetical protein
MHGKCPYCDKICNSVKFSELPIDDSFGNKLRGLAYSCKFCNAIISIQVDPIAVMNDTVARIKGK